MNYKLYVFVPDDDKVISEVIEAASNAGAGIIGNYSQCAFITKGFGNWKSEEGSNPTVGEVGKASREPEVRVEIICPGDKAPQVRNAIKEAHPYEEPEVDFVRLEEVE